MSRILVALDVPDAGTAMSVARPLVPHVAGFKVGLELMMGAGPEIVDEVGRLGLPVFADVKLHDIPNTVLGAARQLGRRGARWVTVHASGGREMLEAAVEGMAEGGGSGGVLAVSVLTSLDQERLGEIGVDRDLEQQVALLAALAAGAGVEGVVCSVPEISVVKAVAPSLLVVTPGIRPEGAPTHDQRRVATLERALELGADLVVVGRAITAADDPVAAAIALTHPPAPN